jgi:glucose/arabinose dehydrogenase
LVRKPARQWAIAAAKVTPIMVRSRLSRSCACFFDSAGKPIGEYEDFMTGFVISDKEVWGRPVGVAVAQDGSLFVSEDGNGTIWRVSHQR